VTGAGEGWKKENTNEARFRAGKVSPRAPDGGRNRCRITKQTVLRRGAIHEMGGRAKCPRCVNPVSCAKISEGWEV